MKHHYSLHGLAWPVRCKKLTAILVRVSVLLFCTTSFYLLRAQTSSSRLWILPDRAMHFHPSNNSATWERTFSTAAEGPVNAASDAEGNLLFYVRGYKLYNNKNEALADFPVAQNPAPPPAYLTSAGEVAIVPFIEPASCLKRYYVFYLDVSDYGDLKLRAKIVTVNINTEEVVVAEYQQNGSPKVIASEPYQNTYPGFTIMRFGGMAVSPVSQGNVRYLYLVSGMRVQKLVIGNGNAPEFGLGAVTTIYSNTGFYTTHQVQLSHDGSKLLWGTDGGTLQTQTSYSIYYVLSLDNNGDAKVVNGMPEARTFALGMPNGMIYQPGPRCRGVAFNADATKIFVTTGSIASGNNGVWVWDIGPGLYYTYASGRYVASTTSFAISQLQLAPDGYIYALSNQQLVAINTTTESVQQAWTINGVNSNVIQYLPDQVCGENMAQVAPAYPDVNITSSTVIDGNNQGSLLRVKHQMRVRNTGTVLTLRNITVEFGKEGMLNVEPGATLVLENCTLKGFSINGCERHMWQGVFADGSANVRTVVQLNPNAQQNTGVVIRDARIGIRASGAMAEVSGFYSLFTGNEIGIALEGGAYLSDFLHSTFDGETPLIDQQLGSDNGYYDGKKRSLYGVYSTSGIGINHCAFVGGQYGIMAGFASIGIANCNFSLQRKVALSVGNVLNGVASINLTKNTFRDAQNGIEITAAKRGIVYVNGNTFSNIREYGIDAHDNNGVRLYVGQYNGATGSVGALNSFTACGLAAIYMHSNAQYINGGASGTEIYIVGNQIMGVGTFKPNDVYQDNIGMLFSEPGAGSRKFLMFAVNGNNINQVRRGIVAINLIGGNLKKPTISQISIGAARITNNIITSNTGNRSYAGMVLQGSTGLSLIDNKLFSSNLNSRYSNGLILFNSSNSLIHGNSCYGGSGLIAQGSMLNSSYYCNQFFRSYSGMLFENHTLRSVLDLHGDVGIESRHNYFLNRPAGATDIHLVNSQTHRNFWVFTQNQPPPVIKYTSVTGPLSYINVAVAPNVCGLTSYPDSSITGDAVNAPDVTTDGVSGFMDAYYYEQQRTMGYASGAVAYPSLATLVEVENLMSDGEHLREAYEKVRELTFSALPSAWQNIMTDYKMLYETYLSYKLQSTQPRSMPQSAVDILSVIAAKNAITISPAAYSARAILWDERQLFFYPEASEPELLLAGEIGPLCSVSDKAGLSVSLLNASGQPVKQVLTDTAGSFVFPANTSNLTETTATYRLALSLPDGTRLYSPFDTYRNLCLQSDWVLDCNTNLGKKQAAPVEVNTSSAHETPFTVYPNPSSTGHFTLTGVPALTYATVTDMTGKTLLADVALLNGQLFLNQLSAGIYLLKVNVNAQTYEHKICIVK